MLKLIVTDPHDAYKDIFVRDSKLQPQSTLVENNILLLTLFTIDITLIFSHH